MLTRAAALLVDQLLMKRLEVMDWTLFLLLVSVVVPR